MENKPDILTLAKRKYWDELRRLNQQLEEVKERIAWLDELEKDLATLSPKQ